ASLRGESALAGRTQPTSLEQQPKRDIWGAAAAGKYPEWYAPAEDESPATGLINAIGVGMWSLVDTGLFGVPGALVKEEEFLDFEDPVAKWTGAIGGFAGFVAGAPLKVGAKVAQKALPLLARKKLKDLGKKSADEVVRGMKEAAKTGGLSRKATREVTKGYRSLVRQAQVDPRMRGLRFEQATRTYLADYAENAVGRGLMTQTEGVALQTMFKNNIFKRPIQDFIGLMGARGLSQTNPRLARVIGHTLNDSIMFGAIDTIFEAVSMVEDGDYDFTAPLWGVGTGAAFGQLSWLKPRGKAASFKKDFMSGVKDAFARKPYQDMSREQLKAKAKFLGENLKNNNETSNIVFSYAGKKDQSINLRSDGLWDEMKRIWGDKADDALVAVLEREKNKFGKKMMRYAINEEAGNLMMNWRRMMLGGVLFNAHTIYDTWAHEAEPGINDVLPSFLIGAFVQRRSNPEKFDLRPNRMNRLRGNLMILGADPAQLATIPTFDFNYSRFESIFNNTKYESVLELVRDLEIGGDNETVSKDLPEGVASARMKPNLLFDELHQQLRPFFPNIKQLDQISSEDAKRVADALIKIDSSYGDEKGRRKAKERDLLEIQKNFEDSFPELIESINDPENVLGITPETKADGSRILFVPNSVGVSEELKQRAKKGQLLNSRGEPLFGLDAEGNPVKGDEALDLLHNKVDGFQTALTSADQLLLVEKDTNPKTSSKTIDSESLLVDIVEKVTSFEQTVESNFPNNAALAERFSIADSYFEYAELLQRNHALRMGNSVIDTFSRKDDALIGLMERAGVMYSPELIAKTYIIDDISKVDITGSEDAAQLSKDRRFLSRVLQLQRAASIGRQFDIWEIPDTPEGRLKVDIKDINQLRKYLIGKGIKLDNIPTFMQSRLIGQAINERVKDTRLTENQVESLWNLTGVEGASFGVAVEGKPSGFTVKLVDDTRVKNHQDSNMPRLAREYNEIVRKMIDDSNGLVTPVAEKMLVTDMTYMKVLHSSVAEAGYADSSQSARAIIADFMTQLGATEKGWSAFREQLRRFQNENPTNSAVMINWLTKAGVLEPIDKAKGIDWNLKNFNQEIREKLSRYMDAHGFDAKYVERVYVESEQKGRDNLLEDSLERASEKPIDLATFHKRYRIDGEDLTKVTPEEAKLLFDVVIYYDQPNRILNANIINKLLGRIHVDVRGDGSFQPFDGLSQGEKDWIKPDVVGDMIKLLGSQRAQVKLDVIKWNGSDVVKESEVIQFSRLHESMNNLELPYFIIDGRFLVDTLSADGRYIVQREVNIFHDSEALNSLEQKRIRDIREDFESYIKSLPGVFDPKSTDYRDLVGVDGEQGLRIIEIAPGMDPIAVATKDLSNINQPFRELIDEYADRPALDHDGRRLLTDIRTKIDENQTITTDEYDHMLTTLLMKDMLTGSDGDRTFIELLNGADSFKKMSRVKLFNTKKYVRYDKDFILDVAEIYEGDPTIGNPLRRIARNDGYGVAIWNDSVHAQIRPEVEKALRAAGLEGTWIWDNVIGTAHDKVSGFDSIGFVSRDQLRLMHAMAGNDPYSFNPIKPVISSGGADSPLLLGKSLFIYSPELDGFFRGNKDADILLARTGAKVYNPVGDQVDTSTVNVGWAELNNQTNVPLRKISIESLGIMQNKNPEFFEAKLSQADANYMNTSESASMFESEFSKRLETNLDSMANLVKDPISLKQWVIEQLGDEGTIADAMSGESSINTLNNLITFAMHTRDANPMSYSDRIVKNKLYQIFMDSVINGQRSATNQFNREDSHRYGGNAVLIPGAIYGLKPTLVDNNGKMIMRGEVMLPKYTEDLTMKELDKEGFEMRFVRGSEVLTGDQIFGKEHWDILIGRDVESGAGIGEVKEALEYMVSQGEVAEGTSIGIMVRRNPRTRPNDFALMSLKGFLKEQYGNSVAVNSLDVANVMEGDYDFDKADFFFSHRKNMWDHVQRASEFFVQGQDPTEYMEDIPWKLGMAAGKAKINKHEMIASSNVYKAGIGLVQKVPRMLSYLGNVGADGTKNSDIMGFNEQRPNEKFTNPKIILDGISDRGKAEEAEFKLVLDYDNLDFFMRSALETQYIIDAKGKLNKEIAQSIRSWRSEFIFPTKEDSFVPGEAKNKGIGFINDMRSSGNHQGKRVRIFRKIVKKKDGTWDEVNLSELDMAIVNQMLYEYGNFLGVTRDSVYENTGRQKKTEYVDAFNGADRFMSFNKGLNNNLYYKLRNRTGSNVGKENSPWKNDPDFNSYFDVKEKDFKRKPDGKKIFYSAPTAKLLHDDSIGNAAAIAAGTRGSPIDRIMMRFRDVDPLNTSRTKVVGTAINDIVDDWYNQLLGGGSSMDASDADIINQRFVDRADKLTKGVVKGVRDYNRKSQLIRNVKKKIVLIRDSKMRYDAKKKTMDNLNSLINKVESEIGPGFLGKKYLKSRTNKNLPEIEFVLADEKNMIDGTIYYSTMDAVRNSLPWDWQLKPAGKKDLDFIRTIRKLFYGNRTRKKDFLDFGGRQLLTGDELELLDNFPDMNTYYQIETEALAKGFKDHGPSFLYQFMQPAQNRKAVGVFNNRPVSVPYEAQETFDPSSRYRRGMRLLTGVAYGTVKTDAETMRLAREELSMLQFIESQNERFFNKRIERRGLIGEIVGAERLNVGELGRAAKEMIYNNMRLPNFDRDFEKLFGNFDSIKWNRDSMKISSGFNLMNDHMLDFYAGVMKLAGKEKEFESYLNTMHDLNAQYMGYDFINPLEYLSMRAGMDKEVKKIARDVFVDGIFKTELDKKNKTAMDIEKNPVYALMGGASYFKGVSLEKAPTKDIGRYLREAKELADTMEEMKDNISPNSHKARKEYDEIGTKCGF
ncbi:hypothetical protein CMI37_15135, partial [Candidatus Pacearchaeota archaeon]|nr:hypothetical protein [Candidatus Pacearchaeota archaeon]